MKSKRTQEFLEKMGILKDEYIWRGTIGEDPNHLEKSTFLLWKEEYKLRREYKDLFEDEF